MSLFKKIISLVIYIFRGHVRDHIKDNEMLFEIMYIHCGFRCVFIVIQVKVSKFIENDAFKRTESHG